MSVGTDIESCPSRGLNLELLQETDELPFRHKENERVHRLAVAILYYAACVHFQILSCQFPVNAEFQQGHAGIHLEV